MSGVAASENHLRVPMSRPGFAESSNRGFCPRERRASAAMGRAKQYPNELVQAGIRLALEGDLTIVHITHDLGMHSESGCIRRGCPRGRRWQPRRSAEIAAARADPPAAQGELRAAPRQRDPGVGVAVFAHGSTQTDRSSVGVGLIGYPARFPCTWLAPHFHRLRGAGAAEARGCSLIQRTAVVGSRAAPGNAHRRPPTSLSGCRCGSRGCAAPSSVRACRPESRGSRSR
jgi:hypothetical protein